MTRRKRAASSRRPRAGEPRLERTAEVRIETLGSGGDGIARLDGRPVHVPLTLPGDRVRIRLAEQGSARRLTVESWVEQVPRAEPPCRHFGRCGGCRLQHLDPAAYRAWMVEQVESALRRRGLDRIPVRPPLPTAPGSRRRMRFAFDRTDGRLRLGLRAAGSRTIVDLSHCPVARPAIVALLAPLRATLSGLGREPGEILVTETPAGLDVVLIRSGPPGLDERERLAALAEVADLARLGWSPAAGVPAEPLAVRRQVQVAFEGIEVPLPPGAFLQATADAEAMIREAAFEALGDASAVADLFAGCGTFALPLAARGRRVLAIDSDPPMVAALAAGAAAAGLPGQLDARVRDLERDPLRSAELQGFAGVLLDPPRAGAPAQARALADAARQGGAPARIAMVSCRASSFARDARLLVDGGYRLDWVRPIDAFLWSGELELVGAFALPRSRPAGRRRGLIPGRRPST